MIKKWEDLGDNQILQKYGFYISYNANTNASRGGLGESFNMLGAALGRAETALCKMGEKTIFYILNGDFRKDYEQLETFEECKKFYDSKKVEFGSNWSTDEDF